MTETQQLGLAGRLLLWIVGTAIFLVIALLPYALFMRFATDYVVHMTVLSCVGILAGAAAPLRPAADRAAAVTA